MIRLGLTVCLAMAAIACSPSLSNAEASGSVYGPFHPLLLTKMKGQPLLVVFDFQNKGWGKVGFLMGCEKLGDLWSSGGQPVFTITDQKKWNQTLESIPDLVDLRCNSETQKYQAPEQPAAFVVKLRNGKVYRHYVDREEWFNAFGGGDDVHHVSAQVLDEVAPNRGIDLVGSKPLPPKPNPTPIPPACAPVDWGKCISASPSPSNSSSTRYSNSCPFAIQLHLKRYCNGHPMADPLPIKVPANNGGLPVDVPRPSSCSNLGGNQYSLVIASGCKNWLHRADAPVGRPGAFRELRLAA